MVRFYELFLPNRLDENLPSSSPATALRAAQGWLRDLTLTALREFLQRHPYLLSAAEETGLPGVPWSRPFANPYYWAGFIYVGRL